MALVCCVGFVGSITLVACPISLSGSPQTRRGWALHHSNSAPATTSRTAGGCSQGSLPDGATARPAGVVPAATTPATCLSVDSVRGVPDGFKKGETCAGTAPSGYAAQPLSHGRRLSRGQALCDQGTEILGEPADGVRRVVTTRPNHLQSRRSEQLKEATLAAGRIRTVGGDAEQMPPAESLQLEDGLRWTAACSAVAHQRIRPPGVAKPTIVPFTGKQYVRSETAASAAWPGRLTMRTRVYGSYQA